MDGWIKVHRKILQSDMYKSLTSKQRDVLIVLLLMANHRSREWEYNGQIFRTKPGQFVTSRSTILNYCAKDVSEQNVKTALKKLEKWEFLTNKSTKTGRLITIVNWELYQDVPERINQESNQPVTKHQPSINQQLTPTKNEENNEILVRLIGAGLDREKTIWLATRQAANYLYRMRRMQEPFIERRGLIQPDAFLRTGTHSYWIEYDAATEGVATIEEKMERYHTCLEPLQRRWVDSQGKWRRSLNKSPVVWVAKSNARRAYLQQIWEEWRMRQNGQQKGKIEMRFFTAGEETSHLLVSSKEAES